MDNLRLVLVGLAAGVLMILGVNFLVQASRRDSPSAPETAQSQVSRHADAVAKARAAIEAELAAAPDYHQFFDRLKAAFPADYDQNLDRLAERRLSDPAASGLDYFMAETVKALRQSRGVLAAKAEAPALGHVFEVQRQMMKTLGESDPRLCVDFLYGGASQGFYDFSAAHRGLVADMATAGLDAMSDGRAKKVDRTAPTDADFTQLEASLRDRGLSTAEIETLLDGKTADPPIADARMCQVGQMYLETLAGLPETARLRIYSLAVELMARS